MNRSELYQELFAKMAGCDTATVNEVYELMNGFLNELEKGIVDARNGLIYTLSLDTAQSTIDSVADGLNEIKRKLQ